VPFMSDDDIYVSDRFYVIYPLYEGNWLVALNSHVETCGIDVCVQRSWQMLTGESPVVVKVGQPLSQ
jgi:hypothetical protein